MSVIVLLPLPVITIACSSKLNTTCNSQLKEYCCHEEIRQVSIYHQVVLIRNLVITVRIDHHSDGYFISVATGCIANGYYANSITTNTGTTRSVTRALSKITSLKSYFD
jgi:hypothetical protein